MLCGMNKLKEVPKEVIERAREVLKNAQSIEQVRHAQAVILPAVHGFSAEQTAEALGVSRDSVYRFQAAFRQCDDISQLRERRGGPMRRSPWNVGCAADVVIMAFCRRGS